MPLLRIAAALLAAVTAPAALAQSATPVGVRSLGELLVDSPAQAPAEVESLSAGTLSAEVTAVIAAFEVPPQTRVAAGAPLVRLDDTDYRLALRQSEAQLGAARARVELVEGRLARARRLVADGFVSVDDVAALETELAVARADARVQEAAVAVARRALDKTVIRAPSAGLAGSRLAAAGQLAMPGTPLVVFTDLDQVELRADIPAADAASLTAGNHARFESLGQNYPVRLLRLADTIDAGTRTREARLAFTADVPAVGSQGRLTWQRPTGLLPASLLVRREGRLGVFVLEGDRVRFHPVEGAQEGRAAAIDLPADTPIVVQGREALADGDRVHAQ
jgi:RND family efflux transporter MFP subunit